MAIGPADGRAARPGRMRASHADREQVISALKTAFVQGRLAQEELDTRVGQALVARTHAELAVLTDDIPAGLAAPAATGPVNTGPVNTGPVNTGPVNTGPARPVLGVRSGACVTTLAAMLAAVLWSAAVSAGSAAAGAAALAISGIVILALFATGYQVRESRHPRRSAGPLPPGTAS
ncbi:MAG: DUF1707 domain-containing protein [Streptosporangiaceae bacterium]